MNNKILIVLPFSANDGILAEHLCDFIFLLSRRVTQGSVVLVAAGDVHAEMREKVRLAATVAFESVDLISLPHVAEPNRNIQINRLFRVAADHVQHTYRLPWLWLEPDAVPLTPDWLNEIEDTYYNQAKRYAGSFLRAGDNLFLARIAVYPPDAFTDMKPYLDGPTPFNMASGGVVIPKATKNYLVCETAYTDDSVKIRQGSVVLHHDKRGLKMSALREQLEQAANKKKK